MTPVPTIRQMPITRLNISRLETRGHWCLGWDCLTPAEKAGIIISAVVTLIVLLFAYMYYLGRITTAHQEIVLRHQRRRRRHSFALAPTVSLVQLPVPRFPSQQVSYQPVVYHLPLAPLGTVVLPHLQGSSGMIPQQQIPVLLPVQPTTYIQQRPIFQPTTTQKQTARQPQRSVSVPASMSSSGLPPRHPSWPQRLCRAFGLPLGRASTVHSESVPGTPVISQAQTADSHQEASANRRTDKQTELHDALSNSPDVRHNSGPSDDSQESDSSNRTGIGRINSPGSAAATVHSDDYDLISNVHLLHNHQNTANGQGLREEETDVLNVNNSNLSDYHNPLAVLPVRSPFDPMERPPTPTPEMLSSQQHMDQLEFMMPGRRSNGYTPTLSHQPTMRTYHSECDQDHRGRETHRRNWDSTSNLCPSITGLHRY
ncbi:aminoadipate-semialdehyde dehydrogenase large subunit [Fusarium beomiforme]|uniref:Aminoadipate-semialdehyde dehydrogenase large subunit n=1 Tax=Fusarium beomiforme TaxID=44412 RepID=A0A9P5AAD3_9HYPO|nr:aminoadipate-semialdehyde dehydrogenase large subunit [Fusarium beomiforme]